MRTLLLMTAVVVLNSCGFEVVDTGYRGIETRFGEVVGNPLPEGLHFYNPFTSDITELDIREQKTQIKTSAYTRDVQETAVTYVINFYPDKTKIGDFYKGIGKDWAEKIIPQISEGTVKDVIGKYEAVDLVSTRSEAVSRIEAQLREALGKRDVILIKFELENIDFNDAFEAAVEKKVVAVQRADEAKNKTVQVKEEAAQKIVSAQAEAESMKIRSESLSKNKSLVEYEAVQKWDGKLPQYMLGNSVPFLNLSK